MGNYELELDNDRAIDFGVNELFSWLNSEPGRSRSRPCGSVDYKIFGAAVAFGKGCEVV